MPALFPDTVLPDVLDCLEVDDLLLSAMPVSRYWREQVVGHRTYWRTIMLVTDRNAANAPGWWHAHSIELFCLRLSRSGTRPIDVSAVRPDDALAVLDVLALHLPHIRLLKLHAKAEHWDLIFPVLGRIVAPLLESLTLSSDHVNSPNSGRTIVPRDLFTGHAPVLSKVTLTDMDVVSQEDSDPPECFRNLVSFTLAALTYSCSFPHLSTHCRKLKHIGIGGGVLFDNPAFSLPETWRGIAALHITSRRNRWNDLAVAMAHVPLVFLVHCDAGGVYAVCNALGPQLTVAFPFSPPGTWHQPPGRPVIFASHGDPNSCVHDMLISLAHQPWHLPFGSPISVFWNTLFTDRIAQLAIAHENWRELVGEHHLTRFAFLETLVITLTLPDGAQWHHPADASISCPRLQRLVLRQGGPRPAIEAADVAAFAGRALAEAPFPIVLELDGVSLRGSLQGFENRFSQCVASGTSAGA